MFLSLVLDTFGSILDLSTQDPFLLGGLTATVQGGHVTSIDGLIVGEFQLSRHFAGTEVDSNDHSLRRRSVGVATLPWSRNRGPTRRRSQGSPRRASGRRTKRST